MRGPRVHPKLSSAAFCLHRPLPADRQPGLGKGSEEVCGPWDSRTDLSRGGLVQDGALTRPAPGTASLLTEIVLSYVYGWFLNAHHIMCQTLVSSGAP